MDKENKPINEAGNAKDGQKPHHSHNRRKKHYNNKHRHAPQKDVEKDAQVAANDKPTAETKESEANKAQVSDTPHNKNNNNNRHRQKRHKKHRTDLPKKEIAPEAEENLSAQITDVVDEPAITESITFEEPIAEEPVEEAKEEVLVEIIGVRFKAGGKTYYFSPNGITGKKGAYVIVETARGQEFGEIAVANSMVSESEFVPPLRPVIRIATEADIKHHDDNNRKQDEAFKICNEKIIAHKLDMKLIDVQYTFDNTKLLFYFTSSGRVDFRELVKDLASVFKTRIELRQIGIRDEAKLIGGLGICGRPLCCSVFLSDFGQVSIKMAKEQNLSLNSAKISGACGRLMCCLRYEYDTYVKEIKNTPPVDSRVRTEDGIGVVTEISPLAGKVKVRLDDKPEQPPKSYSRENVTILPNQKQ